MKTIVRSFQALKFQHIAFEIDKIILKKKKKEDVLSFELMKDDLDKLYEETKEKLHQIEHRNKKGNINVG